MRKALGRLVIVVAVAVMAAVLPTQGVSAAVTLVSVTASPVTPNTAAQFTLTFTTTRALAPNGDTITVTFPTGMTLPATIGQANVVVTSGTGLAQSPTVPPVVDQPNLTVIITVPNMNPAIPGAATGIPAGAGNNVTFTSPAGISNPVLAGSYTFSLQTSQEAGGTAALVVPRTLVVDPITGPRRTTITVLGRGFTPSSTATVWLDNGAGGGTANDGVLNGSEPTLAQVVANVNGVFTAPITAGSSFVGGSNFISAKDGSGISQSLPFPIFTMTGTVSVAPSTQSSGGQVSVTLLDFPLLLVVDSVTIGGLCVIGGPPPCPAVPAGTQTDATGQAVFTITVPFGVPTGAQTLTATVGGLFSSTTLTINSALLTVAPPTVVPNQTMVLSGSGFTSSRIPGGLGPRGGHQITGTGASVLTFDGAPMPGVTYPINLDAGGNWVTQVKAGLTGSILTPGTFTITATDDLGGTGTVRIQTTARTLTVSPTTSQRGTKVDVKITAFPARDSVVITYNGAQVTSTATDAFGSGTGSFLVPTTAGIPSLNAVVALSLLTGASSSTTHSLPAPTLTVTPTSAAPGGSVTIKASNMPAFSTIGDVSVGGIPALPARAPTTDGSGSVSITVLLPQLPSGVQSVQVTATDTTASGSVTVTDLPAPTAVPAATVLSGLQGPGNLELASSFNYDTGKYEAYVPNLAGNALSMIRPNTVLFITTVSDTRIIVSGVVISLKARVPTPVPIGDTVSLAVF